MQYIKYANFIISLLVIISSSITSAHKVINIGCTEYHDLVENDAITDTVTSQDGTDTCAHKNCACQSIDSAFANPTSNTVFNITADVILSSFFVGIDLVNIMITGYNSPTVKCSSSGGGLYFSTCNNCTVENIIWDGCGAQAVDQYSDPVIQLDNSSDIRIKNCSFQNSLGQAIALADMADSGDITISHCKFLNNNVHDNIGHPGAVIYYYPSGESYSAQYQQYSD